MSAATNWADRAANQRQVRPTTHLLPNKSENDNIPLL